MIPQIIYSFSWMLWRPVARECIIGLRHISCPLVERHFVAYKGWLVSGWWHCFMNIQSRYTVWIHIGSVYPVQAAMYSWLINPVGILASQRPLPAPSTVQPKKQGSWGQQGPTWVLSAPDVPHVGPMNLDIKVTIVELPVFRVVLEDCEGV